MIAAPAAIRSAARLGGQLFEQRNCLLRTFGGHEQMIVEVGRDRIDAYAASPQAAPVIAAMKPTASSDEWMSSVTSRHRKVAASPALCARVLAHNQCQALALLKTISGSMPAGMPAVAVAKTKMPGARLGRIEPSSALKVGLDRSIGSPSQRYRRRHRTDHGEDDGQSADKSRKGGRNGSGSATAA